MLELLLQVFQLLVEPLLAPLLALALGLFRGEPVAHVLQLVVLVPLLLLELVDLLQQRLRALVALLDLPALLVDLALQLVAHLEQLVHGVLLPDREARALLDEAAQVGDFHFQLLDGFLRAHFLLVRRVDHLPRLLDFLF